MGFSHVVPKKNNYMLYGPRAKRGYDWWWHSLTAINKKTGEERPFFFEYYVCNPALGKKKPVFGQLPENKAKGVKPSYVMVKAGCWGEGGIQLHRFYGWKEDGVKVKKGTPFMVDVPECHCENLAMNGHVKVTAEEAAAHPEWMCVGSGEISWDLTMEKIVPFNVGYGTSQLFLRLNAFEMYWHASGIKTKYSGTITLNGEEYEVLPEKSYGYADKNFGGGFTTPWIWLASNNLYSNKKKKQLENSAFDIGGGRPCVFGIHLDRQLLGVMWYEGKEFEFNFSKFWTLCRTKFNAYETSDEIIWKIKQKTLKGKIVYDVHCYKKDMLMVQYEDPDGVKLHNRLWNGGNGTGNVKLYRNLFGFLPILVDDIEVKNMGCEYGEYDRVK